MSSSTTEMGAIQAHSPWGSSQEIHFKVTQTARQWLGHTHFWRPPTDLYEEERKYVVRVEIAGMQDAELTISVDGRLLAIYGDRQHTAQRAAFHQMEIRYGEFLSLVELPGLVDVDHIGAEYDDGFLIVTLPKGLT